MAPTDTDARPSFDVRSVACATAAAVIAVVVSSVFPLASPLVIALILGVIAANTGLSELSVMSGQAAATRLLLRLGVVLLGLKLPVQEILGIGPSGLVVIVVTVATTYFLTIYLGDVLGLDRGFVTLLAAGFSICGAAAIAAVDDAVRARERYVGLALAMVTIFGSAMVLLVPWLGQLLGLTSRQTAIWAGASIHEVAQVVAAASLVGTTAIAIATTVKLGRVALLAPMYAIASRRADQRARHGAPVLPWFVVAFAVAVAARSTGLIPDWARSGTDVVTTLLLAGGMFGLGMAIRGRDIWPVPVKALVLAVASTLVAAGASLLLITSLT